MRKALIIFLTASMSVFSMTNKEIIDQGMLKQKQVFEKYFNTSEDKKKSRKDANLLNKVYPEIIEWLYSRNKQTHEAELSRMNREKSEGRKEFKPLLATYNEYVNENSVFSKILLSNFLPVKEDIQSYVYTTAYITLENFYLNVNTVIEGKKDEKTLKENVDTIINYLYHSGDSRTKEDYLNMTSSDLRKIVSEEFVKLDGILGKKGLTGSESFKKQVNSVRNTLKKVEKLYNKYDTNFDLYIDSLDMKSESKDNLKKLVKFEEISNLKFLIQSLENPEEKDKKGDGNGEK